jgi:hypothetical protein
MPQIPALSRRSLAFALMATLTLSLGAACTTVSVTAPAHPLITGQWQLDKAASDLVDTKVNVAVADWEAKLRKHAGDAVVDNGATGSGYGHRGGRGGGGGSQGGGTADSSGQSADYSYEEFDAFRPLGPDFTEGRRRLTLVLTPPGALHNDLGGDYVRIGRDRLPPRDYHPDEEFSRLDEYGAAKIDSGWSTNAFEVQARYSSRAMLVEHYEVDARTDTLTLSYHLRDPMVGKIDLNSVYHRQ